MNALKNLFHRLIGMAQRHPGLLALFGFLSGLASFVLIDRNESLAQFIAMLMLISWLWLVLEQTLRQGVLARFGIDMPPALLRFATQMVHQESYFFVLPFFFAATHWNTGQIWVTGLLAGCALISLIDPLYYRQLAPRRTLFVAFHALSLFAVLLVALPIIVHLSTGQSYFIALGLSLLLSLPALGGLLPQGTAWRSPALIALLLIFAFGSWQLRDIVPPVPMRMAEVSVTHQVDRATREPGPAVTQVDAATLHQQGLYAWTAIRVPRGLRETVYHVWIHNGDVIDRIPLDVRGGRDEGYRAWSHKRHFPAQPEGDWQIRVATSADRVIGLSRFTVIASPPPITQKQESDADPDTLKPIDSDDEASQTDGAEPLTSEVEEMINPDEAID
jgi:hypothetical protein